MEFEKELIKYIKSKEKGLSINYSGLTPKIEVTKDNTLEKSFHVVEKNFKGVRYYERAYSPIKYTETISQIIYYRILDTIERVRITISNKTTIEEFENFKKLLEDKKIKIQAENSGVFFDVKINQEDKENLRQDLKKILGNNLYSFFNPNKYNATKL